MRERPVGPVGAWPAVACAGDEEDVVLVVEGGVALVRRCVEVHCAPDSVVV